MTAGRVSGPPVVAAGALSVREVHTYIGESHILQGMTFTAEPGETTVLLGRNGAGKSTTLRTLMGILPARSGSIVLTGQELAGRPSHVIARLGIAFVPEDREVFASLSVEENLRLAHRRGATEIEPALERAYHLFPDLRDARRRSAGALSGGQQQMLAIARALVNPNRLILIDEPTKGLAPVIVDRLRDLLVALRDRGETILLVEQNLEFARAVGDRFFVVDEGRVVHSGRMAELDPEALRRYVGV